MGSLMRDGDGVCGLILDFRPMLPVVTHNRGCSGKMDHFGGMFGGSDGALHGPRLLIWGPW